jgi:hypothetical protein
LRDDLACFFDTEVAYDGVERWASVALQLGTVADLAVLFEDSAPYLRL